MCGISARICDISARMCGISATLCGISARMCDISARMDDISKLFKIRNTDIFQVNLTEGVGGGVLFPRTNATLLSKERNDEFHVSGYGMSVKGGINFTFFKHFFIQGELKGGYIDLPDIRTTQSLKTPTYQLHP